MPYVRQEDRTEHLVDAAVTGAGEAVGVGQLTYLLVATCAEYMIRNSPFSYALFAEVIAALECAKLELYRRIGTPYEERKKQENGDVGAIAHLLQTEVLK